MHFSSLDGRDDGGFNGTNFVEIFWIFVMQVEIIFETLLLDKVLQMKMSRSDQTTNLGRAFSWGQIEVGLLSLPLYLCYIMTPGSCGEVGLDVRGCLVVNARVELYRRSAHSRPRTRTHAPPPHTPATALRSYITADWLSPDQVLPTPNSQQSN